MQRPNGQPERNPKRSLAVVLWVLLLFYGSGVYRQLPKTPADYDNRDFASYYQSAHTLLSGVNPYPRYGSAPGDTPTFFLLIEPLAALFNLVGASRTWFAVNLIALSMSLWLLLREAGVRHRWEVAALVLMYPPLAYNLWGGMQQIVLLLVLVLMLLALRRGRDSVAGLALGAAILLRAYPLGLLGYLVALRRWRALWWTLSACAAGAGSTVLLVGWPVARSWLELTNLWHPELPPMGQGASTVGFPNNLNLGAFVKWLCDPTGALPVPEVVSGLALLVELALVVLAFGGSVSRLHGDDRDWRGYGLWIATVTWISPLSWIQFMCCFVPLLVGLAAAWERGDGQVSRRALCTMAMSYGLLTLVPPIGHPLYPLFAHLMTASLRGGNPGARTTAMSTATPSVVSPTSPSAVLSMHHLHWMTAARFVALGLVWLSAWWFVTDALPETPGGDDHSQRVGKL